MNRKAAHLFLATTGLVVLGACSIQQTVKPVSVVAGREICVVENDKVKVGFLDAYRKSLEAKGYLTRLLPGNAPLTTCPMTTTYTANWRWDLATYMAYAEIKAYRNGEPVGEAMYDSRSGGGNMSKFINAEDKIKELVDQLFPVPSGG